MCWVTDDNSPEPYLINQQDFDAKQHTRCT
jgi:hypothetical protein